MKWHKTGLIFLPDTKYDWMVSHAQLPLAVHLNGNIYRVYFSSRDKLKRAHVGYVEIDINQPDKILYLTPEPVLRPGPLGHFDDHGVMASSIVTYNNRMYLYYVGWNPGKQEPLFYHSIGLAVSSDNGKTFQKLFKAPVLSRSEYDPCLVTVPFVRIEGTKWRMWYVSGFKWEKEREVLHSYYHVKYAESKDEVQWVRNGLVCINLKGGERNIARPCVLKEEGIYKMWYSYNAGQGYRIGYAESPDGYVWTRMDDEAGIDVSSSGWDSQALAYPWVFEHEGRKYMLYNGNEFGREGFGLAFTEPGV